MSKKKAKKSWLRLPDKHWRPGLEARKKNANLYGTLGPEIPGFGLAGKKVDVDIPDGEVEVIKEVPAVVTNPDTNEKVTVGTAYIHSDRSVAIKYDDDAPQWAMDLIKATADQVGYSLETGGPVDGST